MDLVKVLAVAGSSSVFIIVIELIRRGRLKERYSLLWLTASAVLFILSLSRHMLESLSQVMGIYYPPSLLFLFAFLFLLVISLHFSVVLSSLSEKSKKLTQELALLNLELRVLKQRAGDAKREHGRSDK